MAKKVAAIFDVDGTVVRGGTERRFFLYLCRRGLLKPARLLAFLAQLATRPKERFQNKGYLKGLRVKELVHLGRVCYQECIVPRIRPRALALIKAHRRQGHLIVLITGSLDFLVRPLLEDLKADRLIATELSQRDGLFTGELKNLHPRGENKRLLLEELARQEHLDLSSSFAYGDHLEDAPLLLSVGRPVAVNPTRALRRLAQKRGWPVEFF